MPEFIYQMRAVRKAHGDKVILDNVTLAFLPGAKIGVLGPNGTGKSTLLRMMAGVEQPSNGEARLMPGFSVGILEQEPQLDETKTVLGNVEEGVAETKALLDRYNEIAEQMATDYSDALLEEMGKLQEQLDHREAWDLDSQLDQAMDALRCPPPDAEVSVLSGGEKRRVSRSRDRRTSRSASGLRTSWSGCGRVRGPGRRRAAPACSATKRWPPRPTRTANWTSRKSRYRRAPGWAAWSSRSRTWPRASMTAC